jgi:hypothetical protein
MSSGEPSATTPMGGLLLNPVLTFHSGLCQPFKRGHQRLTFRQYASYSAPNFRWSVGSSYRITNRCTPRAIAATTAIESRLACPKTIHSPIQPAAKPTYIGIADVAVEAYNYQALRWRDRCRSAVSGPAKIPNATQGNRDSHDRGYGGEPAPMGCTRFVVESKPLGQEEEPQ